jgi:hypothetical protein
MTHPGRSKPFTFIKRSATAAAQAVEALRKGASGVFFVD